MASPWIVTILCGFLGSTLVQADLSPPAVFNLGPEIIKEQLTQQLKEHDATTTLQKLPLLSAMQGNSARGIPVFDNLVRSVLKYIIWMKVTSANILQLVVEPSTYKQELVVRIPLDMEAGFNTPLVKTMVKFHMNTEVQALVRVEKSESGHAHLNLSYCSSSGNTLRLTLLHKLSFMINSVAKNVMNLLVPALPQMVKTHLCPVIQQAFDDMYADFLRLTTEPIALSPGALEFSFLFPAIQDSNILLHLRARLLDSQARVTKWFNSSMTPLTEFTPDGAPFSLIWRQDLVNAVVSALIPAEELLVLLDFVLPEVARELQASIQEINKEAANKLGPTQIVKIAPYSSPQILLSQDSARAAQRVMLEVFATNQDVKPFFSLGIEANSQALFFTEGDRLMFNFNNISIDRIQLMISDIGLFNAETLKGIMTKILASALLPYENGKLRTGIPLSIAKALGYEDSMWSVMEGALKLSPASS
ncbi:BPI fold-containing family B member 1 [Nannospalax galili]|uniref:BPI fold containing family B, member 1 n=1 Tax=Nannospalax galili TaxID=1026970 RepID=A0A8C6R4B2_NANGA|nr:BPI fold-containing family B member 1 [Nannospalax galili]